MSRSDRVVGSSELLVVAERVDIERLLVQVVSGVSLSFSGGSAELPRTLLANVTLHSQLLRMYQVRAAVWAGSTLCLQRAIADGRTDTQINNAVLLSMLMYCLH